MREGSERCAVDGKPGDLSSAARPLPSREPVGAAPVGTELSDLPAAAKPSSSVGGGYGHEGAEDERSGTWLSRESWIMRSKEGLGRPPPRGKSGGQRSQEAPGGADREGMEAEKNRTCQDILPQDSCCA